MRNKRKMLGLVVTLVALALAAGWTAGCSGDGSEKPDMTPKGTPYPGMQGAKMTVPSRDNK